MRRLSCRALGRLQESGIFSLLSFFLFFFLGLFFLKQKTDFINDFTTLHKRYKSQDVFHMEKSGRMYFFERINGIQFLCYNMGKSMLSP